MSDESFSILVVDDDDNQRWMLKKYLQKHGLNVSVAEDGVAMRKLISNDSFNLVLLDISMPGEDGFSIARYLREHHDVGIIMLTAAGELFDRVLGLEIGADDYITKPFEPRELLARVRSVLRRIGGKRTSTLSTKNQQNEQSVSENHAQFGVYSLDEPGCRLLDEQGNEVAITAMEFDLLKAFADNPDAVLSREFLLNLSHKRDVEALDRSIDIRIARVRRKIESDPAKPKIIKTIRGIGYLYVKEK